MKACVLEKPYDVRIKELPIPEPKDDEVLRELLSLEFVQMMSGITKAPEKRIRVLAGMNMPG